VTVRKLFPLAAAFGLWVGGSAWADAPKPMSKEDNQKLADAVATKLKTSGVTKGAKVEISTQDGVVDLSGSCPSQAQHQDILKALMTVKGVRRIESGIKVEGEIAPVAMPPAMMPVPASGFNPVPMQMPVKPAAGMEPGANEPVPLNGGVGVAPLDPAGPPLPGHAWPTYAPYNNYSRVAYPGSYPYNAFPYIGPFYPFPKVPLGWRKVTLEWDDGHWYMGRITTPHDYWRVRFW
jgi:hypothetical protein